MRIVIQRERARAKIEGHKQEEMVVVSSFSSHDCVCVCGEKRVWTGLMGILCVKSVLATSVGIS